MDALPTQQVANEERIVHLGEGPGWAGRRVRLCARTEPVRRLRFKVRQSGVTLDCNGVTFDGSAEGELRSVGWALDVDRSVNRPIRGVAIRDCAFVGYQRGLVLSGPSITDPDAASRSLRRFTVEDVQVVDAGGEAIYVGAHSRDFVFRRVTVTNAYLTAIYLDAHSRHTTIRDSRFVHNGWSRCSLGREAIAIDASTDNVIEHNVFEDNRYAGVAIYKNCGESQTPRTQYANFNRIAHNVFSGHRSEDGAAVIIASRQGVVLEDNDCLSDECLDPVVNERRRRDYARFNSVAYNVFHENATAIRVQDDHNLVIGNVIEEGGGRVVVGSEFLTSIGQPILDVTVAANRGAVGSSEQR